MPGKNEYGVPGLSATAVRFDANPKKIGCGQHGGLGDQEQQPFLFANGGDFAPGTRCEAPTAIVDIAPTVLQYLGIASGADRFDGAPLPAS